MYNTPDELPNELINFIKNNSPVDMYDILVGGRRSGLIHTDDNQLIVSTIHRMLDKNYIRYTSQNRLVACVDKIETSKDK